MSEIQNILDEILTDNSPPKDIRICHVRDMDNFFRNPRDFSSIIIVIKEKIANIPMQKILKKHKNSRQKYVKILNREIANMDNIAILPMELSNQDVHDILKTQLYNICGYKQNYLMFYQSQQMNKQMKIQEKAPKTNFKIKYNISKLFHNKNYFIYRSQKLIITHCITTKVKTRINVITDDFQIFLHQPYLFICAIGQYLYLYTQESLNTQQIEKVKISKLQVKALCRYNNGFMMGGYNRSPLPGGKHTEKRQIYYVEELNKKQNQKTKPLKTIQIPKNKEPVSIISVQNPYIICFCSPNIYVLNIFTDQILLTLQKQISQLFLLQGRYACNTLNAIGISKNKKNIFTMDVENLPIFGVQISEHEQNCNSICQSKQGHIFFSNQNQVWEYNPLFRQKKLFKKYQQTDKVIQVICTLRNTFLTVIQRKNAQICETIIQVFHFQ